MSRLLIHALVLAAALGALRVFLVHQGWLFGSDRVFLVDLLVSAVFVVSIGFTRFRLNQQQEKSEDKTQGNVPFNDLLTTATAVIGVPVLLTSLLNLIAPSTPANLTASPCRKAQTHNVRFLGVTTGPIGNTTRSGPGLSFPQTDRFESNCIVGFEGYCVGDPVTDPVAKPWVETRWLLSAQHSEGPSRWIARGLSGEPVDPRFMTFAYVKPQSPNRALRYLGDEVCRDGNAMPARVTVTPSIGDDGQISFAAQADHAAWIGIALALPPESLRSGSPIRWVASGPTDKNGQFTGRWNPSVTADSLAADPDTPVTATILAVPCLGPVGPATAESASLLKYEFDEDGRANPSTGETADDLRDRLMTMACDTEQFESGAASTPGADD
ncbi:hypothetical protein [Micromonospora zamorensis]|uniref:hypothetical protein n=1 Tax=Micromonospora zamorensis TaxID=709883 RepID=UPI003CF27F6B